MLMNLGSGRLAWACNNRPYIVPICFACDADHLYCFSTLGRKIEWMRATTICRTSFSLDNAWKSEYARICEEP
jgi:uncharacterized protein